MLKSAGFIIFSLDPETKEPQKVILGNNHKGNATFPKGHIEEDDTTILDAAYRELYEESGILRGEIYQTNDSTLETDDDGITPRVKYFIGYTYNTPSLKCLDPEELTVVQWVDVSKLNPDGLKSMGLRFKRKERYKAFDYALASIQRVETAPKSKHHYQSRSILAC